MALKDIPKMIRNGLIQKENHSLNDTPAAVIIAKRAPFVGDIISIIAAPY